MTQAAFLQAIIDRPQRPSIPANSQCCQQAEDKWAPEGDDFASVG